MPQSQSQSQRQLLARVDGEVHKVLKKKLIDDGLSYQTWLDQRIKEYLGPQALRQAERNAKTRKAQQREHREQT